MKEKIYQLLLDGDGYVIGSSSTTIEGGIDYGGDIPEDFLEKWRGYHLVDGALMLDENRITEIEQASEKEVHEAAVSQKLEIMRTQQIEVALRMAIQGMDLPDDKAMEVALIYSEYEPNRAYAVGDVFRYGLNADEEPQLYKVVQAHTSQSDWKPDGLPALYKAIGFTGSGVPIWTQPGGAHDAYRKGDRVDYNGVIWVSDIDGNVWAPGVHGWTKKA